MQGSYCKAVHGVHYIHLAKTSQLQLPLGLAIFKIFVNGAQQGGDFPAIIQRIKGNYEMNISDLARRMVGFVRQGWRWRLNMDGQVEVKLLLLQVTDSKSGLDGQ